MTVLLEVRGLYKTFGGVTATKNVSLDVIEGEVHAIIGPNGAGKTTLISQLCGEQFPDAGKVRFNGRDITKASGPARAKMGIARSFQITTVFQDMTCWKMSPWQPRPMTGIPIASGAMPIVNRKSTARRWSD